MPHLGRISGTGQITVSGQNPEPARYEIDVSQDDLPGGLKQAQGRLWADDAVLWKMFDGNDEATLTLESGETVQVLFRAGSIGSGECEISVSGPVPGF